MRDGWISAKFGELATLVKGVSYASEDYCNPGEGSIFLTIKCVSKEGGFKHEGIKYFKGKLLASQFLQSGDLVIANTDLTRAGDIIGAPMVVPYLDGTAITMSMDLSKVVEYQDKVDRSFLYYLLMTDRVRRFMKDHASGSTVLHLQTKSVPFLDLDIPLKISEQSKIAEVLTKVDQAIEQTESLIAKQQRIKTGLMQDLLTRGIDEHGSLRSEETHEFKDSPLGRIPVEWEVVHLSECYAEPSRNGLYKSKDFYGLGSPMIHMPQMFVGLNVDMESAVHVDVDRSEVNRFGLELHDLLIARRSLVLEGAGRCALVPHISEPTTFESSIIRVRLNKKKLNPVFANYFLNSEKGYRMRLPFIRQVAVSGVSGEDVGQFSIPIPEIEEQQRIVDYSQNSDIDLKKLVSAKNKIIRLKTGLMQDLLTGKVRVTSLMENREVCS